MAQPSVDPHGQCLGLPSCGILCLRVSRGLGDHKNEAWLGVWCALYFHSAVLVTWNLLGVHANTTISPLVPRVLEEQNSTAKRQGQSLVLLLTNFSFPWSGGGGLSFPVCSVRLLALEI